VILVLGSIAVTASAQPPGGFGGGMGMFGGMFGGGGGAGGGMTLMLVRMPEVQTELNLTDDEKTKLTSLGDEMREKMQDVFGQINFQDMQNATPEEQQKFRDDLGKKMADATKGLDDKVGGILDATQSKRLHELVLQRQGAAALTRPEVVKQLTLTPDQVTQITKIQKDAAPTMASMPRMDPDQSPEERRTAMQAAFKKMQAQGQKAQKDSLAVLNDDQMLEWTKMCGKTFKFPELPAFGRRGGNPPPQ
jgi:hypothetical protein